jgi:DNA-binding transcriptional LysR family regulator
VRGRDRRDEGGVTIATPDGLAALWIAPRIGDFLSRNPRIHVSMDCRAGPPRETDFRADIAITADAGQAQIGDDTSLLAMTHYIFVASPSYLETYGTPKSMAAAVGEHRTLRQSGQIFQRETWGPRANAIEALAQFSFESNSSLAVVAALRGGAGVATVPSYLLASAPELVIVGGESSVPIRLWMIVRKEAKDAARVLRVVEWLRSMFDTKTNPWFRDEFVPPTEFANCPAKDSPARPEAKLNAIATTPHRVNPFFRHAFRPHETDVETHRPPWFGLRRARAVRPGANCPPRAPGRRPRGRLATSQPHAEQLYPLASALHAKLAWRGPRKRNRLYPTPRAHALRV